MATVCEMREHGMETELEYKNNDNLLVLNLHRCDIFLGGFVVIYICTLCVFSLVISV